jgi:hypothetical protein
MTATIVQRRGSRVSPRRRGHQASRHAIPAERHAATASSPAAAEDRQPYLIFVRDSQRGMVSDGLNYIGRRVAEREAAKIWRQLGQEAEVRRSPLA